MNGYNFKLMFTESAMLLKNYLSDNFMLKHCIGVWLRQFVKTLTWILNGYNFKLMFTESAILLKNYLSDNFMLEHCIGVWLRQFVKTLTWIFNLYGSNENLEFFLSVWFEHWSKSKHSWVTFIG